MFFFYSICKKLYLTYFIYSDYTIYSFEIYFGVYINEVDIIFFSACGIMANEGDGKSGLCGLYGCYRGIS